MHKNASRPKQNTRNRSARKRSARKPSAKHAKRCSRYRGEDGPYIVAQKILIEPFVNSVVKSEATSVETMKKTLLSLAKADDEYRKHIEDALHDALDKSMSERSETNKDSGLRMLWGLADGLTIPQGEVGDKLIKYMFGKVEGELPADHEDEDEKDILRMFAVETKKGSLIPLGTGNYAEVFKFEYDGLTFVVKELKRNSRLRSIEREINGHQLVRGLSHEGVAVVRNIYINHGGWKIIMDYGCRAECCVELYKFLAVLNHKNDLGLTKADKSKIIQAHATFSWSPKVDILHQISSAVKHLHDHLLVHRDIKTENIMLHVPTMKCKLVDFGFVCREQQCDNSVMGTLEFAAPELAEKRNHNRKVDVWSLACVFLAVLWLEDFGVELRGQYAARLFEASIRNGSIVINNLNKENSNFTTILCDNCFEEQTDRRWAADEVVRHTTAELGRLGKLKFRTQNSGAGTF